MSKSASRRLHLVGLRPLDAGVVRVFLRLLAQDARLDHTWHLTDHPEADVCLLGPDVPPPRDVRLCVSILPTDAPPPPPGQPYLRRPLQLEDFIDLLNAIPLVEPEPVDLLAPQFLAHQIHIELDTRLRLRRWPAAHALAARGEFRRLAAFLSARYLTMQELATHSQVDWPVCVEFLHAMHALGLLERHEGHACPHHHGVAMVPPQGVASTRSAPIVVPVPSPSHGAPARVLGMLERLRGRLGLTGHNGRAAHAG
jgi:hypothetical protein